MLKMERIKTANRSGKELFNSLINKDSQKKTYSNFEKLAYEYIDLLNDYKYILNINTVISERFDKITDLFPTPSEIDLIIQELLNKENENIKRRIQTLKSFRKITVALYQGNKLRPDRRDKRDKKD